MSTINVTNLSGRGGGTPNLPDGAVISGVATVTNLKPTNVNVSGAVTATTFDGSLKSTGTPTLGLGVTINSSGVNVSGVLTATTLYGDGSNLTGIAVTISPINYNPDVGGSPNIDTGIGITFNQAVIAGSGDIKIRQVGAAGTILESFGVGSSISISGGNFNFTPTSNFANDSVIFLDIPAGAFTSPDGSVSSVAIGYTFNTTAIGYALYSWGQNDNGELGQNNNGDSFRKSSPVQIPGTTWANVSRGTNDSSMMLSTKSDGTLWAWGNNDKGGLGQNSRVKYSSPVQVGSDTTWSGYDLDDNKLATGNKSGCLAIKTDGTLWSWGYDDYGQLGVNGQGTTYSSPVQIPGTTWAVCAMEYQIGGAIKTDGTLWVWGRNYYGELGQNSRAEFSSPVQIPGTTWSNIVCGAEFNLLSKTDGTLWVIGNNNYGQLGQNSPAPSGRSSPVQIPGTSWGEGIMAGKHIAGAVRTDGTLWTWGLNEAGQLGQGNGNYYSSPVQIPGTTWGKKSRESFCSYWSMHNVKTDGTLWGWGYNTSGQLGQNTSTQSNPNSPVQVGSDTQWNMIGGNPFTPVAVTRDTTP